jgi:hypothetical protein
MSSLRLLVHPAGYGARGQLFDAAIAGRQIACRSTQPLLDSARVLLAAGHNPSAPIAVRHVGARHDALRSTVGAAASLTVEEGDRSPAFRAHRPWDGLPGEVVR